MQELSIFLVSLKLPDPKAAKGIYDIREKWNLKSSKEKDNLQEKEKEQRKTEEKG